jgi:acetoin utilization deacetylase AcuC-like enzyme
VSKNTKSTSWFALLWHPRHHVVPTRPMGFCVFCNVAVVALYAQCVHKLQFVLIINYDVHHGNGTHDAFYNVFDIFFMSTHQLLLSLSLCSLLQ